MKIITILIIDNTNTFNLKRNSVIDPNGEILEPSVYLDSSAPIDKVNASESSTLTKEQLEKLRKTKTTEIDKQQKNFLTMI